jgi:hypothetical protein
VEAKPQNVTDGTGARGLRRGKPTEMGLPWRGVGHDVRNGRANHVRSTPCATAPWRSRLNLASPPPPLWMKSGAELRDENGRKNIHIISFSYLFYETETEKSIGIRDRNKQTFKNDKVGMKNMLVMVSNSSRKLH